MNEMSNDDVDGCVVPLRSTSFCHAPGMLRWAKVGYATEQRRQGPVAPFIAIFAEGFGLGVTLAELVLRGETVAKVEGDAVVLMLTEDELRLYRCANPRKPQGDDGVGQQPDLVVAD